MDDIVNFSMKKKTQNAGKTKTQSSLLKNTLDPAKFRMAYELFLKKKGRIFFPASREKTRLLVF